MDKMREQFEAWWEAQTSIDPYIKGEMWDAWQASRAAVTIAMSAPIVLATNSGPFWRGYAKSYEKFKLAIEAVGLKVAP